MEKTIKADAVALGLAELAARKRVVPATLNRAADEADSVAEEGEADSVDLVGLAIPV